MAALRSTRRRHGACAPSPPRPHPREQGPRDLAPSDRDDVEPRERVLATARAGFPYALAARLPADRDRFEFVDARRAREPGRLPFDPALRGLHQQVDVEPESRAERLPAFRAELASDPRYNVVPRSLLAAEEGPHSRSSSMKILFALTLEYTRVRSG